MKQWRSRRTEKFKAPSGDEYVLCIPDVITLISAWKDAGVEFTIDNKEFAERIAVDNVVAEFLLKFVKKPKLMEKPTAKSLSVKELMEDRTDTLAIYREIIKRFTGITDKDAEFFRSFNVSPQSGVVGASQSETSKRASKASNKRSSQADVLGRGHSEQHPGMVEGAVGR